MSSTSSGKRGRSARSARWMTPSSSHAPEPSSSFSSGIAEQDHRRTPRRTHSSTSSATSSSPSAPHRRQRLVRLRRRADEQRHDEVLEVEPRLADERAQRSRSGAGVADACREGGHVDNLRAPLRSAPSARTRTVGALTAGRDFQSRRRARRAQHRTGRVDARTPPTWDWSFETDGALALDRAEDWEVRPRRTPGV